MGRVTDINDSSGTALAHYTYDSLGRRDTVTYANGTAKEFSYDSSYRLAEVQNPTNNDDHDYAYTYDKVGNRLSMTVDGSDLHSYTYDKLYQVTDVDYPVGHFAMDTTFNYDDGTDIRGQTLR